MRNAARVAQRKTTMRHMLDTMHFHACGGAILAGHDAGDGRGYQYCDRCSAYAIDGEDGEPQDIPNGTDADANRAAWDNCDERSPAAEVAA